MSFSSLLSRRQAGALLVALSAAAIAACGGGGDGGDTAPPSASAVATSYAAGPITGFGSVIVNGVRYDDSAAQVLDAEDRLRDREQLKLGMMVEVDGTAMDHGMGIGRALRIRFGSEIVGPVGAVDPALGTLEVLGQPVVVTDTTVFDDGIAGGLAGIAVGDVLEVHAQFDAASGQYRATRLELEASAAAYQLRGPVAELDPAAGTFRIGGALIRYAGLAELPPDLANGLTVRVRLQTTPVDGQWVALSVRSGLRKIDDRPDGHLRGIVTAFTSTADFAVNGMQVDASGATFPDGTAGIVVGARVEVEGAVRAGVLVATTVELDDRHLRERHRFELHGLVESLDTGARTFVLRGVTVAYGTGVSWKNGSEADLANGRRIEVKGQPSADRSRLEATEIAFE